MKLLIPTVASVALCVASLSAVAMTRADYYGDAASSVAAERTIVVGPSTRALLVNMGEIVKLVINGQEYGWHFDGTLSSFDLNQIVPQGTLDHKVPVYVAPVPYAGDSGD